MGYYIPNNEPIQNKGAESIMPPNSFEDIPENKALICQVDNFAFKANGLVFSKGEYDAFTYPDDHRPKKWFLMDKEQAHQLSGYTE